MTETKSFTVKDVDAFCAFLQEQVDNGSSVADAFQAFRDARPKIPGEGEGVVIVLNYGPKSHAMFGTDTKPVKDGLMALNTEGKKDVVSFNGKLEFGAGWVITNKTKLGTVTAFLDENEISHVEVERDVFAAGGTGSNDAEAPVKAPPKGKSSAKAAPKAAPKAKAPAKGKAKSKAKAQDEDEEEGDLSSMTLAQLKALAKEEGLVVTGTKDALVARIEEHRGKGDGEKDAEADEPEAEDEGKALTKKKIDELKDILREDGLSTTGAKDVLIARILAHRKGKDATPAKSTKGKAKGKEAPAPKKGAKASAPAKGKAKAAPKGKAQEGAKLIAKKNDHGNYEEEETGVVFVEAPVGTGGRPVKIAVGVQNPDSEETGLASVNPLDEEMVAECEKRKWRYLTDDMMKTIAKKDAELHEQLIALRGEATGEEVKGEGEEEVEEDEE